MDETAAPAPAPESRTIGQRLRAGRERAGLSVPAAAEKLHLDPKVIEALEADRFAELGASVYVRGHLRRYGDFVGERGIDLVAAYTAQSESRPPPPDLTQAPKGEHHADVRRLVTPLTGLAGAALLALAIWWILSGSKTGSPVAVAARTTPVAEPLPAPDAVVAASTPMPADAQPAAATPVVVKDLATESPAPARKDDAVVARPTRLKLELTSDSWVEVYDSRGERLFYDVATAGSVQSVAGRPPLRVVLGNSAGVTVEVDGQAREIPGNARDGDAAQFVVNRSGSLSRAR
jgi:cytoskeleton protein RodZ